MAFAAAVSAHGGVGVSSAVATVIGHAPGAVGAFAFVGRGRDVRGGMGVVGGVTAAIASTAGFAAAGGPFAGHVGGLDVS